MRLFFLAIVIFIYIYTPVHAEKYTNNVVTVTVTAQGYNHNSPWQKLAVVKKVLSGIVIEENRILTVAYKMADHVFVEVSKFGADRKYHAEVILNDYNNGLAIIKVKDNSFFKGLKPVKFNESGFEKRGKARIVRWDKSGILKTHSIEFQKSSVEFYQSYGGVLIHYMTSDIDSAGKGEPVFIGGRLSGIATWHYPKKKMVKVTDLIIIKRMLNDLDHGSYEGLPFFYVEDAALENDVNLREYLGLNNEDTGILVLNVPPKTSGNSVLIKNDVILSIDGVNIDDNGLYKSDKFGKLNFYGIIYFNHYVGDTLRMKIIRKKKKIDIQFKLKGFSDDNLLIPPISYDVQPSFFIIGGMVFQELTRDYLSIWGKEWTDKANKRLMYYYDNFSEYPTPINKRIIILSRVLPASVNRGYHDINNLILHKVNGVEVKDIIHLKNFIDKSENKFIKFDFIGETTVIIDNNEAKSDGKKILQKYNIHMPFYLGN